MVFSQSLKKNEDFRKVYENGVSLADSFLVMYKLPNNSNELPVARKNLLDSI